MKRLLLLLLAAVGAAAAVTPAAAHPPTLTVALGGDTMFGRLTEHGWRGHDSDLDRWSTTLRAADVAFVNLETGICPRGRTHSPFPLLWSPPNSLDALAAAGVDVVSVANNHALDCGPNGLTRTVAALDERGIGAAGVAPDGVVSLSDDVVVLAATFRPPPYRAGANRPVVTAGGEALRRRVTQLRQRHPDALLIVSLHWGMERATEPAAWQRLLARELITAGANLIAGHGSHTAQPTEYLDGGVVIYSLGNFQFDDRSELGHPRPPAVLTFQKTSGGWTAGHHGSHP